MSLFLVGNHCRIVVREGRAAAVALAENGCQPLDSTARRLAALGVTRQGAPPIVRSAVPITRHGSGRSPMRDPSGLT